MNQDQVKYIIKGIKIINLQASLIIVQLTIIVFLMVMLSGCGVDPDDFKAKDSDGCPSSGCEAPAPAESEPEPAETNPPATATTETVSTSTTTTQTKTVSTETVPDSQNEFPCEEGKICRGMTFEQVLAVLGEPDKISSLAYYTTWTYTETAWDADKCVPPFIPKYSDLDIDCTVEFKDDEVYSNRDLNADLIDPVNW
jgi:hypothetical protein